MATGDDVKLLGATASPYVNRVQFALNIKSINYEFILERLPDKSDLLLKSNPIYKKIPVLIHAGNSSPICESLVIVEYIDEFWSDGRPSILPSDPHDRAIARFWAFYIDQKWFPLIIELRKEEDEEGKASLKEKIYEGLRILEDAFVKCSRGKPFFGGETIGYLDIVLGCFLGWLKVAETTGKINIFDEKRTPELVRWAERFSSEKVIQGVIPTPERLLEILKMFKSSAAASASK